MVKKKNFWKTVYSFRFVYLIFLPVAAYYIIFCYMPMLNTQTGGILMAFKYFRFNSDFFHMKWVGLKWFQQLLVLPEFWRALRNTLIISFGRLIIETPMPIILAIALNEVRNSKFKKFAQTVFTFPNFLSWVLAISILRNLLTTDGLINRIFDGFNGSPINFLSSRSMIMNLVLLFVMDIWKSAGWGAIIYMATMVGIDPSLYEAAEIDGANRWDRICHITWPGIKPLVSLMIVLSCGNILNAGFDQIFNLRNPMNMPSLNIFDTFIYDLGFGTRNLSFSVAAGLFKSVINVALLLTANHVMHLLGQEGLFGKGVKE